MINLISAFLNVSNFLYFENKQNKKTPPKQQQQQQLQLQ